MHGHGSSESGTWSLMVRASSIAAAMSVMFQGFTRIAPAPNDCAAPANSLSTSTPAEQGGQGFANATTRRSMLIIF